MKLICLETSAKTASAAVVTEEKVLGEISITAGLTHSQTILPALEALLAGCSMKIADADGFAVSIGPGSFTGLRIGIGAVKGLSQGSKKGCVGVSTLEALAANVTGFDGVICPILDARAQQVYGAMFESGMPPVRMMEDTAEKLTAFLDRVEGTGCDALFVGDGAAAFEGMIRERLGARAHFAPAQHQGLRAASACALAMQYAGNEENPVTA